jgi:hypothetical protein
MSFEIGFLSIVPTLGEVLVHAHCLFQPQPTGLKLNLKMKDVFFSGSGSVKVVLLFK